MVYAPTSVDPRPTLGGTGVTEIDDASENPGIFSESVTGLIPGTGYSFAAFVTTGAGTTYTPVATFKTLANASLVPAPPELIGRVAVSRSRRKTTYTLTFAGPLDPASASDRCLYRVFEGVTRRVKKHQEKVYIEPLKIKRVIYNPVLDSVTLALARPHRGPVEVTIKPGLETAAGLSSNRSIRQIVPLAILTHDRVAATDVDRAPASGASVPTAVGPHHSR